ncbi:MAG: PKD domain-containing protein [Acidobacteria bacterium]|nr:PKD domain-containing protein [Acidobacteriota bacterium]
MNASIRIVALGLAGALAAACTMKDQEAPPLTGPSEFGTSVNVQVTPDVLQQDGASQAVVAVTVYNSVGQPASGVPLRAEIRVNGQSVDFGTLSARSIVTGSDGRAPLVYTAPFVSASVESIVEITATPIGTNYANAVGRNAVIRLVPTGVVLPPSGLNPAFTFSPQAPSQGQGVFFDATTSAAPSNNPITQYRWDFGDGRTASGQTATHAFSNAASYFVRLTISDASGRSVSTTQTVTVGAGALPTASFTFGPTPVRANIPVNFNGTSSTAAAGRSIVSYRWEYGDGSPVESGAQVAHAFATAATYTVTLTVTDDVGRTHTTNRTVTVQ